MRKDGWSANMLEVELGINRMVIGGILIDAGLGGKPVGEDNMRCPKCREKGHGANGCPNGDALDQLDAAEGYVEGKQPPINEKQYANIKQAHFQYNVSLSTLRMNYPTLTVEQMQAACNSQNYDEYKRKL